MVSDFAILTARLPPLASMSDPLDTLSFLAIAVATES